jgi:hypothetical protein
MSVRKAADRVGQRVFGGPKEQIDLAPESDTPLARARLGLQPNDDDVTTRFVPRNDGAPLVDYTGGFQGIAGLSERVASPYSAQARKAAQEAERLADVVDYSRGVPARVEDQRSRVERLKRSLGLSGEERKVHQKLQEHIRYAMAAEDGDLLEDTNESIDWGWITAEQGRTAEDWDREQQRRQGRADREDQRPGWRVTFLGADHNSGYGDNITIEAPEGFR